MSERVSEKECKCEKVRESMSEGEGEGEGVNELYITGKMTNPLKNNTKLSKEFELF